MPNSNNSQINPIAKLNKAPKTIEPINFLFVSSFPKKDLTTEYPKEEKINPDIVCNISS